MSFGGKEEDGLPADKPFIGDPIKQYKKDRGEYPANNEQWFTYKRPVVLDGASHPRAYLEVFDATMVDQVSGGDAPAPKGHYKIKAFEQDRGAVSGLKGIPKKSAGKNRPRAVAFYQGRVWYAGVNSVDFNTNIYFSQIMIGDTPPNVAGKCFQKRDPTSEEAPDLLPDDGGILVIPEIDEVIKLFSKNEALLIFCTNGVWMVTGSQETGFKANDYTVAKITDTPALSALSFASVDNNPIWWNRDGIWTVLTGGPGQAPQVQSLTDKSIKTFFQNIPAESKKWAKGAYNHRLKRVQWIYADEAPAETTDRFKYNRALHLDILSGAFYPWTFTTADQDIEVVEEDVPSTLTFNSPIIRGIFSISGDASERVSVDVVDSFGELVEADAEQVIIKVTRRVAVDDVFKYVIDINPDDTGIG